MRQEFWKELNEARHQGVCKYWENVFPEANVIDFNLLVELNQYIVSVTGQNVLQNNSASISGAHADARIKPFFTEFINNYKRIDTEIDFNSLLFFSFSDGHHSVNLHRDTETVFLIQGYGECVFVAVNDDGSQKDLYRMKTGDAIILPPMYSHKSVPLGPRVTLSLGGLPKQHSH
jgi:hypothetical protein|tara:strand:+ start:382 stop:906 length:525 start_codon:yes stop_codon:yes gene_type:complete